MAKGYWVIMYRAIKDPVKFETYRNLSGSVMQAAGANFLVRGMPGKVCEMGKMERVVVIEFDNVEKAMQIYDSPGYQAALKTLGDGAERDLRIVEGA